MISQLLADSYQNPTSQWQVMVSCILISFIYHNVIITDIVHNKCNVLESSWNCLPPAPGPWKNWLPQNWSLVPKRLGTRSKTLLPRSWQMDPIFPLLPPALDIFADLTSKVKTVLFFKQSCQLPQESLTAWKVSTWPLAWFSSRGERK